VTQPDYVPLATADRLRPIERLPVAQPWRAERPGDEANPSVPTGPRFGRTGPDLGYGLGLARRLVPRLQLTGDESPQDAMWGCFATGARRASLHGRAPVIYDMEHAATLWGFLGDAPGELVDYRVPLFKGVAHDYWAQRAIADRVTEEALRMTPAQVRDSVATDWRAPFVG
jgi:hypothetical protein